MSIRLLMLAPPGAGKGTQAERLAERYGIAHLATGELLRAEVEAGSDQGKAVQEYIDRGDLVPDEVIMQVVGTRLLEAVEGGGFLLDGFPRNLAQAEQSFELAKEIGGIELQAVIHLEVNREELRRRMIARAREEGREDDNRATIEHRFEVYDKETAPLVDYYEGRGILHRVDGEGEVDDVTERIERELAGIGD
jgi:adenylate kinase